MAKKSTILKGLPAVQAANLLDGIIYGAVKMAHLDNPNRTMRDIAECVLINFAIKDVSYKTVMSTYYRFERHSRGEGFAEDDTEGQPQNA